MKYVFKCYFYGLLIYNVRNELVVIDYNVYCEREVVVNKDGSKWWEWSLCILLNILKIMDFKYI